MAVASQMYYDRNPHNNPIYQKAPPQIHINSNPPLYYDKNPKNNPIYDGHESKQNLALQDDMVDISTAAPVKVDFVEPPTYNGCNPCCCWTLREGAVAVGIWTLIYSIAMLGVFGWQTAEMSFQRQRLLSVQVPFYQPYDTYDSRYPGSYRRFYGSPESYVVTTLLVIHIVQVIAEFCVLGASVGLIWGIHCSVVWLIWLWLMSMAFEILAGGAYCVVVWSSNYRGYKFDAIAIVTALFILLNLYCFMVVIAALRAVKKGALVKPKPSFRRTKSRRPMVVDYYDYDSAHISYDQFGTPIDPYVKQGYYSSEQASPNYGQGGKYTQQEYDYYRSQTAPRKNDPYHPGGWETQPPYYDQQPETNQPPYYDQQKGPAYENNNYRTTPPIGDMQEPPITKKQAPIVYSEPMRQQATPRPPRQQLQPGGNATGPSDNEVDLPLPSGTENITPSEKPTEPWGMPPDVKGEVVDDAKDRHGRSSGKKKHKSRAESPHRHRHGSRSRHRRSGSDDSHEKQRRHKDVEGHHHRHHHKRHGSRSHSRHSHRHHSHSRNSSRRHHSHDRHRSSSRRKADSITSESRTEQTQTVPIVTRPSSAEEGALSGYQPPQSSYGRAIAIPQHIVLPPPPAGFGGPNAPPPKMTINSEIRITYPGRPGSNGKDSSGASGENAPPGPSTSTIPPETPPPRHYYTTTVPGPTGTGATGATNNA